MRVDPPDMINEGEAIPRNVEIEGGAVSCNRLKARREWSLANIQSLGRGGPVDILKREGRTSRLRVRLLLQLELLRKTARASSNVWSSW